MRMLWFEKMDDEVIMPLNVLDKKEECEKKSGDANNGSAEVVMLERFLPRVELRVLLVEADYSTRQIIAALLRKCSYTVTAVPDGLKAWEMLKKKAPELDLILTEVDLPAISGFALLTLIMEHDICKNIPVIMMSSNDSVSMVLKCMLKGAADFLIKPVRRNELRNLWQHVWRRHALSMPPQNTTAPHQKLKTTPENNSASNQSSGSVTSSQKHNKCSEKLSEAQSTCTSPFLEAESAHMENMQDASQLKSSLKLSSIDALKHEQSTKFETKSAELNDDTGEKSITNMPGAARCKKTVKSTNVRLEQDRGCAETKIQDEDSRAELSVAKPDNVKICECKDEFVEHSRGAIDLIATFENLPKPANETCSLNEGNTTKFDFGTQLELSLRRDFSASSCKQVSEATEEVQGLNHSNTSAFSRYSGSKLLQPILPTPCITSPEVNNTDWDSHESQNLFGNNVDTCQYDGSNKNQENMTTLAIGQCGQVGPKLSNSQYGLFPASGLTSDLKSRGHGTVLTFVPYAQSGVHVLWNPKPVFQKESSPFPTSTSSQSNPSHYSEQSHHCSDDATLLQQNIHDKSRLHHARHDDSPAAGKSLCHDAANRSAYGSLGSRSDGNATSTLVINSNLQGFSDSGFRNFDGKRSTDSHHPSQREAALIKFRQKRKERCYEKKVRYQRRKRVAEKRPRVKGQFARQVNNDHPAPDAGGDF